MVTNSNSHIENRIAISNTKYDNNIINYVGKDQDVEMTKKPKAGLSFRIPEDLKQEIKTASEYEHLQQTSYIVSAINDRLAKTYKRKKMQDETKLKEKELD